MARVTKDLQVRIAEIIDTAEALFNARGYHETQISDIVKAIGVAQGTFYYYFKSKEDVVEAIVRRKVDRILAEIEEMVNEKDSDAPQKIRIVVRAVINDIRHRDGLLFEYLFSEQNLHIVDKLGRQGGIRFAPALRRIIDEGIEKKYFSVGHPEETVEFILAIIRAIIESLYKKDAEEKLATRLEIVQKLIEAVLGAKTGTINLQE